MRSQSWNNNWVYFKLITKEQTCDRLKNGSACYSSISKTNIDLESKLTLSNFHKKETEEYIKEYVLKLSKIFKFKYKFNNEDEIEITELRSTFYMNTFLCIFRYLFENLLNNGNLNKELITTFVQDKRRKDFLWKFTDAFNTSKFKMGGSNHCINYNGSINNLRLRTTKELEEYDKIPNKGYSPIHSFFKKEE